MILMESGVNKKKNVDSVGLVFLGRPLGGEQVEPLLDGDPLSGVLVLRREPGWVSTEGGVARRVGFGQCVDPVPLLRHVVHQVHSEAVLLLRSVIKLESL